MNIHDHALSKLSALRSEHANAITLHAERCAPYDAESLLEIFECIAMQYTTICVVEHGFANENLYSVDVRRNDGDGNFMTLYDDNLHATNDTVEQVEMAFTTKSQALDVAMGIAREIAMYP